MASREGAVARALAFFDGNGFRDRLAELVAVPSTSQDPGHEADVQRYLERAIRPWLEQMGFSVASACQSAGRVRPDPDRRADGGCRPARPC